MHKGQFQQMVAILSTGRTGTVALARYFGDTYELVHAVHEPRPSRHLRLASNRYLCHKIGRDQLARRLESARRKLFAKISEPIYLESNPFLHGFLDVLPEVYSPLKVVHVVRDPRTYVRSCMNFGDFRGLKKWASNWTYWMLKPDYLESSPQRRWRQMSEPERLAWRWNAINCELDRGAQILGENYRRVRFEDILATDGAGLAQLAEWLGLAPNERLLSKVKEAKINASADHGFPKWENLDAGTRAAVLSHCAQRMQAYGYEEPTRPQ